MSDRNLAFAGAALLVAGLFTPVVTLPFLGNVNLFNNGSNLLALAIVALAAMAAVLAAKDRLADAIWPALGATGIVIYAFGRLQYALTEMREAATEGLEGNPFAGLAQAAVGSIQLQWGWLVLGAGAGLLIYAAVKARKAADLPLFSMSDSLARAIAGVSLLLLVIAPAWDMFNRWTSEEPAPETAAGGADVTSSDLGASSAETKGPSSEEAAYIRQNLRLYDLDAKHFEGILDGRVPGVKFKIKNNGNRTLNRVDVRVVFRDENDNPIAEEEYSPVFVSEYNFSGDSTPLRPNYIWQQEPDQFYAAKKVPSEWKTGNAVATITDIEFAEAE